jgi:hypothetical protein
MRTRGVGYTGSFVLNLLYVLHERTFDSFPQAFLEQNTGFDDLLLPD